MSNLNPYAHVVLSASEALLFMASLYGWGSIANQWLRGGKPSCWAYPSALGIAVLVYLGGLVNAAGIAKPMVLRGLLLLGLGMALFFVFRSFSSLHKGRSETGKQAEKSLWNTLSNLTCLALILAVFIFLVMVLMPVRTFNFHDDYHMYLLWPLRMLLTGTLGGNPFDHLGVSSLGGQSFMQGMFLAFGKIVDINAFDAIICLVLVLGLVKELGDLIGVRPVFVIAAGLLAVVINPHYANITALYSGSLMLLGLAYAAVLLVRSYRAPASSGLILSVVPCALFCTALLCLKTTFVFFVLSFGVVSFLGSLLLIKERKQVLLAHLFLGVVTTILLLPWISLYWNRYLREIYYLLNDISYARGTTAAPGPNEGVLTSLFSNQGLFYGNTYRDYLGIVGMLLLALIATAWIARKNKDRRKAYLTVPLLAVFMGAIICYGLQFNFGPPRLVVRYSLPILIGAAPAAVLLAGWLWTQGTSGRQPDFALKKGALFFAVLLLASQLGLLWTFRTSFRERIQRAYSHRTLLSFPFAETAEYKLYNDYVLSAKARARVLEIQDMIPAGATIFAWVSMPLYFDFTRNPIYTINESAVDYNLLVMPLDRGAEQMREFLHQFGIRYIIWDYNGYGMKKPAHMGSLQNKLVWILRQLIASSRVLYNNGVIAVFDIGPLGPGNTNGQRTTVPPRSGACLMLDAERNGNRS
jgi:hypothetical protein